MRPKMKLLSLFALAIAVSAGPIEVEGVTPPGLVVRPDVGIVVSSNDNPSTSQNSSAVLSDPSSDFNETSEDATNNTSVASSRKRTVDGFSLVFSGSGTGPDDRDAAIVGDGYLTFTTVPNNNYDPDACQQACYQIPQCVFVNMYYEYNRDANTDVFCALYSQYHTAAEKTNFGGQYRLPWPAGPTYIQDSTGYAYDPLVRPPTLSGYNLVFGPLNGATNAPGYMGYASLDSYDVQACAALCNNRGPDSNGGACQFFNIWQGVVDGNPTSYTCSMYYLGTDASTATNYGQGDLQVAHSRGYQRISILPDGGFETYQCSIYDTCWTYSYTYWVGTSPPGGTYDATIFHSWQDARTGSGVALLGSSTGDDSLPGTLTPANPLNTKPGERYMITFFQTSSYSGPTNEAAAFFEVHWNGVTVLSVHPGYTPWTYYQVEVTAEGNDLLAFYGGAAPAWTFIDDISVFLVSSM